MENRQTKEYYLNQYKAQLAKKKTQHDAPELYTYMYNLFDQLLVLLTDLSEETYWRRIPYILGIDAKLSLLTEAVSLESFSDKELIRLIEQDYRSYYKELCGYDLSMETSHSLIFYVK
ncbi:hypothetical protein A5882_003665 [Enterococcus sp. 4E1_DIV0656]|uniref:DUF7006 family protein n=1 Tax=Enterococcus sp. 4E1_DIV0656 TaxID=1834180 RepID=UPI000A38F990|nr:hypothetical protein [Enterococcus sp. 4E1_DIV0656]OTO08986.1 hypothetical protein A5882_003665 [Enterococcus sp. 4E1_DIV0656]